MDVLDLIRKKTRPMTALLEELVKLESPSVDKEAVDLCSNRFVQALRQEGGEITVYPQDQIGDIFLSEFPPRSSDAIGERILILTHTDTVWPVGTIRHRPFPRLHRQTSIQSGM